MDCFSPGVRGHFQELVFVRGMRGRMGKALASECMWRMAGYVAETEGDASFWRLGPASCCRVFQSQGRSWSRDEEPSRPVDLLDIADVLREEAE